MKRNGRHRNGTHAKRRRARIARRLNLVHWRRALPVLIDGLAKMEAAIFERMYSPIWPPNVIMDAINAQAEMVAEPTDVIPDEVHGLPDPFDKGDS